jgi:exocyst complex component 2
MAELDRSILRHYNISTSYPTEWPAEKDQSDASDDESLLPRGPPPSSSRLMPPKDNNLFSRSKTKRYSVLERNVRQRRIQDPKFEVSGNGERKATQRDEPDPLGSADSTVRLLRQRGLPVDEDAQLRK